MSAVRLPGLPARVEVYEVGPRDGLQNENATVPTEVKAEFESAHGPLPTP